MSEWKPPVGLTKVVGAALEHGRAFMVNHGTDTGDSAFVALTVKWDRNEVRLTWHTRDAGSYRLFSSLARTATRSWHDVTMATAIQMVEGSLEAAA